MAERIDVLVYNEACAYSLLDGAQLERLVAAENAWALLPVLDGEARILVQELAQDDPFVARVVIDDELAEDELGWVGHATGVIEIGAHGLILAGGFDADVFAELLAEGESEYCDRIPVPPGRWQVDLYTYITSVNADFCLGAEAGTVTARCAAAFEASGDGGPWPHWLARWCFEGCEGLKEHPLWADSDSARAEGRLRIDDDHRETISLLVQLRPAKGGIVRTPRNNNGMLDPGAGGRWPDGFPNSPMSDSIEREEDDLDDPPQPGWEVQRPEVSALLETFESTPVETAVEIGFDKLDLAVLIGWFIDPSGGQALAVELPVGAAMTWPWVHIPAPQDGRTGIVFDCDREAARTRRTIDGLSPWITSLPPGTRLTLMAVNPESYEALLALSGELDAACWRIDAVAPAIGSETVVAMLELARWVDGDEPYRAACEEELQGVSELLDGWQRATQIRVDWHPDGLEVRVARNDRAMVAMQVFRHRYTELLPGLDAVMDEEAAVASQLEAIKAGHPILYQ